MKHKLTSIIKSCLWALLVLLFPISSGVLSVILSMDTIETLFLQGAFMLASLLPPAILILCRKWHWSAIGFAPLDAAGTGKALYFLPLLLIFVPAAVKGFHADSPLYVLGNFFLYLSVGFAEEVYFRGIIPMYLNKAFSRKGMIFLSTVIFGFGHIAGALSGGSSLEIVLTVLNALIFGWLAIEITVLAKSILPAALIHFFFDFETKIVAIAGRELLIAECIRGGLMFFGALWLAVIIFKQHTSNPQEGLLH